MFELNVAKVNNIIPAHLCTAPASKSNKILFIELNTWILFHLNQRSLSALICYFIQIIKNEEHSYYAPELKSLFGKGAQQNIRRKRTTASKPISFHILFLQTDIYLFTYIIMIIFII
jgi:hypothetical protein